MGQFSSKVKYNFSEKDIAQMSTMIESKSVEADKLNQHVLQQRYKIILLKREMNSISRENALVRDNKRSLQKQLVELKERTGKNKNAVSHLKNEKTVYLNELEFLCVTINQMQDTLDKNSALAPAVTLKRAVGNTNSSRNDARSKRKKVEIDKSDSFFNNSIK